MLRNHLHYVNCAYQRHISPVDVYRNSQHSPIRICELCTLVRTSGSFEYCHFLVVICDSVSEVFSFVNKIFIRLHQAVSLLLRWDPIFIDDTKLLPDLLKDLNVPRKDKNQMEPDIISNTPKWSTINRVGKVNLENRQAVHSIDEQSTNTPKCHVISYSRRPQNINNNYIYNNIHPGDNDNNILRCHPNDIPDGRNRLSSDHFHTGSHLKEANAQVNNSILFGSGVFDPYCAHHSNLILNPISHESLNSQVNDDHRELRNQELTLNCYVVNHRQRSQHETGNRDIDKSETDVTKFLWNEQQACDIDREISKDIVQTLRAIGDDLDAKMRQCNYTFSKVVVDALKMNTGGLLPPTLNQNNLLGVAMAASIAFFKLIHQ